MISVKRKGALMWISWLYVFLANAHSDTEINDLSNSRGNLYQHTHTQISVKILKFTRNMSEI